MTEKVDIVDSLGNIQKYSVNKNKIDTYPLLHLQIVVACIFNDKGELLVQQRSFNKTTEPGKIDKVCGAVQSGETPEQTVIREAMEEAGVQLSKLQLIDTRINQYKRYRYLFVGFSNDEPKQMNPDEVVWSKFVFYEELLAKQESKVWLFVDDFFENVDLAFQFSARQQ